MGKDIWGHLSEKQSLRELRKLVGLPELTQKEVDCKRCSQTMISDFSGKRRVEFYCHRCRYWMDKQLEELF